MLSTMPWHEDKLLKYHGADHLKQFKQHVTYLSIFTVYVCCASSFAFPSPSCQGISAIQNTNCEPGGEDKPWLQNNMFKNG